MGRTVSINLDTRSFASKGEAKLFFRAMLNRYLPNDRVSNMDAKELNALLKLHTEHVQKVGAGIDHFEVMAADHGTQCFRIVRVDGTSDDFSYIHCITPKRD